ncbi:hypothetical protein PR048_002752 [Dryococelus australis]|uniref:HAT C-terminal dimerisation domain-containing protein n=1 Tax=Dryococelus australis TaxID=614101 RepID=A0ABQ9IL30_9NEOP|nr:hypothetical protein PR048_002752 [Dryococelus australis]
MKSPAPWIPCDKSIYKLGNALECFSEHAKTSYRQKCSEFAENFFRVSQGQQQPILNQLSNERARQDAVNLVILGSIVDTIILCGRQELALRGKHGAGTVKTQVTEMNDGNFRSLILTGQGIAETIISALKWFKEGLKSRPANASEAFAICDKNFFLNVKKLLQIMTTLPVSTATPERTLSTSRRLKTYLSNSMGETRLTGLALIPVHRSIQVKTEVFSRFLKIPGRISVSL